jgi:hypothetical protein
VKKYIAMIVIMLMVLTGCFATNKWPGCNASFPADAKIVQIANNYEKCLADIGTVLVLTNGANISLLKIYSAEQAIFVVDSVIDVLNEPITELFLRDYVYVHMGQFPELFIITDIFVTSFNTNDYVDQDTKDIIKSFLEKQVKPLLQARIDALK